MTIGATKTIVWRRRLAHLAVALLPIAVTAAIYASARQVYGFQMVNAVGYAIWPTPHALGWPFTLLAASGLVHAALSIGGVVLRQSCSPRSLLQAVALIPTGRSSGATTPYLSLKMAYLAVYPLSIAAAA